MKARALVFLFLLFHPAVAYPQDTLPPVVVTSSRLRDVEEPVTRVPGKVISITAEEIQKLGAKTVQEVLQYQTGVVLYDSIGNDFQQTIDFRGFNGQPVTVTSVFVDGVRVNESDFNQVNFDLIPINDVEKIEILPGTATLFGRNALGGVINITTKRGRTDKVHFGFDIGGGNYGRQKYSFSAGGPLPLPNFDYYLGVTRELGAGFREDSGGRLTRIFTKLGYKLGDGTDATLAYTRVLDHLKQAGAAPARRLRVDYDDNFTPGDFSTSSLHQIALNLRQKLPANLSLALNSFFRKNDTELFTVGQFGRFRALVDYLQAGGTAQLTHDGNLFGKRNKLDLGIEYSRNLSSNLTALDFNANKATRENILGAYLQDSYQLFESLNLVAGLRYDWDQINFVDHLSPAFSFRKIYNRLNPKAGLTYNPLKNLGFYFNYAEGFRAPVAEEFAAFGPPPTFTPTVVQLKPVKSRNFEVGVRGNVDSWLEGSLALFYIPVRDEILFQVTDATTFTGQNANVDRTLRRGVELSLKARYQKLLEYFVNYTVTKATFETDVLLFSGQVEKGDELPLVPRHRVSTGVTVNPLDNLSLSLFGNFVGRQFLNNDEPNNGKKLASYFVLGSRASYQWQNWTGSITINNLTNRKYSTYGILGAEPFRVPAPGTALFTNISFRY
ncbi:MAG: TonB-dependent receptor [Deltaproteobacteria bacterium]|nr:TonB-dependent receptor [Deltaproteobacteria bacterium]